MSRTILKWREELDLDAIMRSVEDGV